MFQIPGFLWSPFWVLLFKTKPFCPQIIYVLTSQHLLSPLSSWAWTGQCGMIYQLSRAYCRKRAPNEVFYFKQGTSGFQAQYTTSTTEMTLISLSPMSWEIVTLYGYNLSQQNAESISFETRPWSQCVRLRTVCLPILSTLITQPETTSTY